MTVKADFASEILRYPHAFYLFTKWDRNNMLTILLFCVISTRVTSMLRITLAAGWIWLHALFFCVSNQCSSAEEDAINKPYRPLPSGQVSYQEAVGLLLGLVPVCIGTSWPLGGSLASAGVIASSLAYTFLKLDNHWLTKNIMNVAIWYPFYLGALTICDPRMAHGSSALTKLSLLILTTIHAGDFPDVMGDEAVGRRTLPIVYPRFARVTLAGLVGAWSLYSPLLSKACIDYLPASGLLVAYRFASYTTPCEDKTSAKAYNVWLMMMHIYFAYTDATVFGPEELFT